MTPDALEALAARQPDGLLWAHGVTGSYVYSESEHRAAVAALRESSWRCFHCGEVFIDKDAAKEHFGQDVPLWSSPLCVIKAEEGGLGAKIRSLESELAEACHQRDEYENDARLWFESNADRVRRIGHHEWWQELDSKQGEIMALQAEVAALRGQTWQPIEDYERPDYHDAVLVCREGETWVISAYQTDRNAWLPEGDVDDGSPGSGLFVHPTHFQPLPAPAPQPRAPQQP